MGLKDGVCTACQRQDRNLDKDAPYLLSAANDMDPMPHPRDLPVDHPFYEDLPELSQVEEMLIARVHCFIEVRQVRGVQYKYRGHICNFLCNTPKVYDQLALKVSDLDIIIIRPENYRQDQRLNRQFHKDYRVCRSAVKQWLLYLRGNHPAYKDIVIDDPTISTLPEDAFVDDDLVIKKMEADTGDADVDGDDAEPEVGAVPDLHAERDELTEIEAQLNDVFGVNRTIGRQLRRLPSMSLPTPRWTPLSEFNKSQPLLSWAFPTLFPYGTAEYVNVRQRDVDYPEYIRHLLLYQDPRFAQHPRFRYVGFDTIMRTQANTKSSFFFKKLAGQEHRELSLNDIRQAFQDETPQSEQLVNSISRYAGSMRGIRPFWGAKMRGLTAMIRQVECPHLFLTVSAADYHWDSLMCYMPRYQEWLDAEPRTRIRIARESVRDNPLIASYHFYRRMKIFFEEVLRDKFNISDYWFRFEWQARGSTHCHGLYWMLDAPNPDGLTTDDVKALFTDFWNRHVVAINPEPVHRGMQETYEKRTPMSIHGLELENKMKMVAQFVNRLHTHVHSDQYCLRVVKGTRPRVKECRFYFPEALRDTPGLQLRPGRTYEVFLPVRNDEMLQKYNRLVTMSWQANTDVSPTTGSAAIVEYVAKYAAKAEKVLFSSSACADNRALCQRESATAVSGDEDYEQAYRGPGLLCTGGMPSSSRSTTYRELSGGYQCGPPTQGSASSHVSN
jgi:ATP-dependent DNA helicase PIF1